METQECNVEYECCSPTYAGIPTASWFGTSDLGKEYFQLRVEKGDIFASKYLNETSISYIFKLFNT